MTFQAGFVPVFQRTFARTLAAAAAGPTNLFYDTFTDTDTTLITAHTPDTDTVGGGWVGYVDGVGGSDDYKIISNRAKRVALTNPTEDVAVVANVSDADVTITSIVQVNDAGNPTSGLAVRLTDADNLWLIGIHGGDAFRLLEKNGGSYTARVTNNPTIYPATDYTIVVTLSGNDIAATLDGANDINYSSAFNATATRHGLFLRGENDIADNFTIEP